MVSLIVVDYNGIEKTMNYIKHCKEMIEDSDDMNFIVVDNSLNDKSIEYFRDNNISMDNLDIDISALPNNVQVYKYTYPEYSVILVKANENLGYARGNNLGVEVSKLLFDDKYYLFSNNDLRAYKKFKVSTLIDCFKIDPKIAVVGPEIMNLQGEFQSPIKRISLLGQLILSYHDIVLGGIFGKLTKNNIYDGTSKYAYWVSGAFFIADSEKFNEAGMFDNNTFLYLEEMILSERLLKYGYKVYFYNGVRMIHEHGYTTKDTQGELRSIEIQFKSNCYYYKEYMKASNLTLAFAKLSFKLFKSSYMLKGKIKEKLVANKRGE